MSVPACKLSAEIPNRVCGFIQHERRRWGWEDTKKCFNQLS